jgi:hypothetical protein
MDDEAWELWEKVSKTTDYWDLGKGNEPTIEFDYKCVKIFSIVDQFNSVSERFNLDHHVIIKVAKSFAEHVTLPKEDFTVYEPPKIIEPTPMVLAPLEIVASLTVDGFYEKLMSTSTQVGIASFHIELLIP